MRFTKCQHSGGRLRCYESSNRTCPLRGKFYEVVLRWALTSGTARSLDTSTVLGGMNIGGSEAVAIWGADIAKLFKAPEAILGWLLGSQVGRIGITADICADLKQAKSKWKTTT